MKTIRIVVAIVDTRQLTMYKEDGTTEVIPQGDPRLRRVLEVAMPQLQANKQPDGSTWADVDLTEVADNSYADFQEQSKGIRFFRVAKAALKKLIGAELGPDTTPVRPQYHGMLPPPSPAATVQPATPVVVATAPVADLKTVLPYPPKQEWEDERMDGFDKSDDAQGEDDQAETFEPVEQVPEIKVEQTMSIVDEIIANAIPATSKDFHEEGIVKQRPMAVGGTTSNDHPDDTAEDTIIAVVDNKIIPGVELIKSQFGRAAKMGSTQGVENFLKRLGGVIEQRSHSVEDLLKFMERADLPIADDGSIIIYKILRRSDDAYVDCHSGKVRQWIGAYVCMDPSLVDHVRNNECSNGLHVARRGYINNFSGDVCVLAKLAPEDVITVPTYDANKMRVCGYHILFELPQGLYGLLKANRPITSTDDGKRLLANAMSGNHPRKTHEVRITGSYGGGVQVKEISVMEEPLPVLTPEAPKQVEALSEDHATGDVPVAPSAVEEVAKAALSKREQAKVLYDAWDNAPASEVEAALQALKDFKKQSKKGWDVLGITDPAVTGETPSVKVNQTKAAAVHAIAEAGRKAAPPVKKALPVASEGSPKERIAKLMEIGLSTDVCRKIYDIKKASKKSWEVLGVSEETSLFILKTIGKG